MGEHHFGPGDGWVPERVLVVDIGGSHLKVRATGQPDERKEDSGPDLTATDAVRMIHKLSEGWDYQAVAIGYPGPVTEDIPRKDPVNLGEGWRGFNFGAALGRPTRVMNDALMQALGSYDGGRMLFLGLGTGLGSALVLDNLGHPLELAHLPYRKHRTYEDYLGETGMKRIGKKKWRKRVNDVVERFRAAFLVDYVVLGGGNVRLLDELPEGARRGDNANAFAGGFRLWAEGGVRI